MAIVSKQSLLNIWHPDATLYALDQSNFVESAAFNLNDITSNGNTASDVNGIILTVIPDTISMIGSANGSIQIGPYLNSGVIQAGSQDRLSYVSITADNSDIGTGLFIGNAGGSINVLASSFTGNRTQTFQDADGIIALKTDINLNLSQVLANGDTASSKFGLLTVTPDNITIQNDTAGTLTNISSNTIEVRGEPFPSVSNTATIGIYDTGAYQEVVSTDNSSSVYLEADNGQLDTGIFIRNSGGNIGILANTFSTSRIQWIQDADGTIALIEDINLANNLQAVLNAGNTASDAGFTIFYSSDPAQLVAVTIGEISVQGATGYVGIYNNEAETIGVVDFYDLSSNGELFLGASLSSGVLHRQYLQDADGVVALLPTSATPSSSADSMGIEGQIAYDNSFMYIKTAGGWMSSPLSSF